MYTFSVGTPHIQKQQQQQLYLHMKMVNGWADQQIRLRIVKPAPLVVPRQALELTRNGDKKLTDVRLLLPKLQQIVAAKKAQIAIEKKRWRQLDAISRQLANGVIEELEIVAHKQQEEGGDDGENDDKDGEGGEGREGNNETTEESASQFCILRECTFVVVVFGISKWKI